MFTHVIWDWNGTLLDDASACAEAINVLLRRRRLPTVTFEQYLEVFDFPVRNYYVELGFDFSTERWDDLAKEYHAVYAVTSAASPLRTGSIDMLRTLRAQGRTLSILSACELALLKRMMGERGVLEFFEHICGLSDLFAHSKVAIGHALLDRTSHAPARSVLVGDTTHDFEVAQAMGVSCILMTGGHQAESKLRRCGCPVVSTFDAVLERLKP